MTTLILSLQTLWRKLRAWLVWSVASLQLVPSDNDVRSPVLTLYLSLNIGRERLALPKLCDNQEARVGPWYVQTRSFFCRVNVDNTSKVLREKTEQTVFGVLPVLQDYPVPREPQENPEWYLILSRDWWVKVPVTVIPCLLVWNSFQYFSCSFAMFFSICWIPFPLPVSGFHSFHISWKFENALLNMKISHQASFMMLLLYSSLWNCPKATKANGDWMV